MALESSTAQVHRAAVDLARLEQIGRELLEALGEDLTRPDLAETPGRWARWWQEFIDYDAGKIDTLFESSTVGQMVVVSPMRVWSLCAHHLLPFWCDVSVAYIPNGKVLGLSKFARIAHRYAHQLQIQEGLVAQIADEVQQITGASDVAVMGQGVHLCMTMRGIQTPAVMTSLAVRGVFESDAMRRAEFMRVVGILGKSF
jgi:GTP cyclohydrolase IA